MKNAMNNRMSLLRLASLLVAVVSLWPGPLRAQQQPGHPVVGFLTSGSIASLNKSWMEGFHRGLGESGFIDGLNVTVEFRAADDQYDRLPALAGELVQRQVGVIVAAGGPVSALAARKATGSIPIVFTTIADPVRSGLVASLNRPGGNATGMAGLTSELDVKRLELLLQIKPQAKTIGVLINPKRPGVEANSKELAAAAAKMGRSPRRRSTRWSSPPIRSSISAGHRWWRWRRATSYRGSTSGASSSPTAA
jgi:putative ABC transport system substrate-binding protein